MRESLRPGRSAGWRYASRRAEALGINFSPCLCQNQPAISRPHLDQPEREEFCHRDLVEVASGTSIAEFQKSVTFARGEVAFHVGIPGRSGGARAG